MVDYSKWDKIELSDDSDIEVHPNVDKRSFIRAKQRQIHEQREARKRQIKQLKLEREINSALLGRIGRLSTALESQKETQDVEKNPEEVLLRVLVEVEAGETEERPSGEEAKEGGLTYGKMVTTLVEQVKKEVDSEHSALEGRDKYEKFLEVIGRHQKKILEMAGEGEKKLAELEKEERSKITSESIHDGFNTGYVNKEKEGDTKKASAAPAGGKKKVETVEQLNPNVSAIPPPSSTSSTAATAESDEDVQASPLALEFVKIPSTNLAQLGSFIRANPQITHERETDGLLVEAFNSQMAGKSAYAKTCVHHALLLQYCRQIGAGGLRMFFEKISDKSHQASQVFQDDVNKTYSRIKTRAAELVKEKEANKGKEEVEQIQLHAVDPGTTITISIPPKDAADEEGKRKREIFEGFGESLRKALETGSLDEVNKELGKMSVPEAEGVVAALSEAGMLSLESEIIDATTEEGKAQIKKLEEEAQRKKDALWEPDGGDILEVDEDVDDVIQHPVPEKK